MAVGVKEWVESEDARAGQSESFATIRVGPCRKRKGKDRKGIVDISPGLTIIISSKKKRRKVGRDRKTKRSGNRDHMGLASIKKRSISCLSCPRHTAVGFGRTKIVKGGKENGQELLHQIATHGPQKGGEEETGSG